MMNENMENKVIEAVETGTEIVTKTAGDNDMLKRLGGSFLSATAAIVVYEGGKKLIGFIKSKAKAHKEKKNEQSETSDEKTENVEN